MLNFLKSLMNESSNGKANTGVWKDLADFTRRAIPLMKDHADLDNEALYDLFIAEGFPPRYAGQIITFLPSAFTMLMLPQVHWSATYRVIPEKGTPVVKRYDETPAFIEIHAATIAYFHTEADRDTVFAIASRGPELDAINNAVADGATLETIQLGETVIFE